MNLKDTWKQNAIIHKHLCFLHRVATCHAEAYEEALARFMQSMDESDLMSLRQGIYKESLGGKDWADNFFWWSFHSWLFERTPTKEDWFNHPGSLQLLQQGRITSSSPPRGFTSFPISSLVASATTITQARSISVKRAKKWSSFFSISSSWWLGMARVHSEKILARCGSLPWFNEAIQDNTTRMQSVTIKSKDRNVEFPSIWTCWYATDFKISKPWFLFAFRILRVMETTCLLYRDPRNMVEEISGLGLRALTYKIFSRCCFSLCLGRLPWQFSSTNILIAIKCSQPDVVTSKNIKNRASVPTPSNSHLWSILRSRCLRDSNRALLPVCFLCSTQ